jgi:hypothetical protein
VISPPTATFRIQISDSNHKFEDLTTTGVDDAGKGWAIPSQSQGWVITTISTIQVA